ncbi:MAG: phosphopentomutase [Alphaproteobacteria bacterium]|nr:phosphopentomutase [Alphaproteobacteria bacterium]
MKRIIILMMDSVGVGASEDAADFGDAGSNTLGHIAEHCKAGYADKEKLRKGKLALPNLARLGLGEIVKESSGLIIKGMECEKPESAFGFAKEISKGKDTSSGHWELAGVPVLFDWGYFQAEYPSFPNELIDAFIEKGGLAGVLGNKAASGTQIIEELGEAHITSKKPIIYTSADSVFQIAAHEEHFGLERLYEICEIARELLEPYNIARVIARPFVGETAETFKRTGNRHDYSLVPPASTVLDKLKDAGGSVIGVGKISDIFAGQGITKYVKAHGNDELFDKTLEEIKTAKDRSIVFTNFVDFDMLWGHRRDVAGYAAGLEYFDRRLPEIKAILQPEDIVIITADHGCDPTAKGTDHTREHVPIIVFGKSIKPMNLGKLETFADIGQSIATYFGLSEMEYGTSFLAKESM